MNMSPGDPDADELIILTGFVDGTIGEPQTSDPAPPPNQSSSAPGTPATRTSISPISPPPAASSQSPAKNPPSSRTSALSTGTITTASLSSKPGTETGATVSTAPPSAGTTRNAERGSLDRKHDQFALKVALPIGLVTLIIIAVATFVILVRRKRRHIAVIPFWERTPPNEGAGHEKGADDAPSPQAGNADSADLVALHAALKNAGMTAAELIELCARRRSRDLEGWGSSSWRTSSLPPGYSSENTSR
ncbi:hypothetical protein AURDEDRAFT_128340 [Auricularia subglabra TFB-10046 SS5]|nr:hypothetical protein AURDEDRAFT_128340 [Auricularia subglabra TFB-10046 SS5]